jgi:hypothetical protein
MKKECVNRLCAGRQRSVLDPVNHLFGFFGYDKQRLEALERADQLNLRHGRCC